MKKALSILLCFALVLGALPVFAEDANASYREYGGGVYILSGENLFTNPDFSPDGDLSQFFTGVNTTTKWDKNSPDPKTGENLVPLSSVCTFREGTDSGSPQNNSFYFGHDSGGSINSEKRAGSYLCENITSASLSYWNGTGSLLCYVPVEAGKTYYFSYNVSSWGSVANSSVRYGGINSDEYCADAASGKISWSGEGFVNVDQYDGNNMNQKGGWTKNEAIITVGDDADYFFFNLYWLQDTSYVCVNGFTLYEAKPAQIIDAETVYISSYAGEKPKLPARVSVTYEGGISGEASAVWESDYDIYRGGVYDVDGTAVSGEFTYPVHAQLSVYSDSLRADYTVSRSVSFDDSFINADFGIYSEKSALAAVALYDGSGRLSSVRFKKISGEETLSLPMPVYEGGYVKTYVWDSALSPITLASTNTVQIRKGGQFMAISDVTLLDSPFKSAQDLNVSYLLDIEADRLLAPVLESASLTPKAQRYGGWEAYNYNGQWGDKGISGHSLGHYMSAAAVSYAATGNAALKERLDYIVSELGRVQSETGKGYIGGLSEEPFTLAFNGTLNVGGFNLNGAWVPWYSVHKIYQGLIDAYTYTKNPTALEVAIKFADWAVDGIEKLSDTQMQKMLTAEHGGMNEVFAELYSLTSDERYLNAAVRFTHDSILSPLASGKDELTGKHANTQIPKIIGAAAVYECDNERTDYKAATEFFWDTVVNNRSFVIGGNSVSEHFEALGAETLHKKTCETCNTYNMIKLSEYLFTREHNVKYMDYVENALYNDILGSQDPETGNKMYFTSLLQGHFRVYGTKENSWWCCTGSGMENPGRYAKCIYYKDADELYVNLYIPSETVWHETGLTLKTQTDFPYSDTVKISVNGSADAKIKLRVPSWIKGEMTVKVNGSLVDAIAEDGYICLSRAWSDSDEIEITLPMALSIYTARDSESKVAFKYGPIVLGADMGVSSRDIDLRESELGIPDTTVSVPSLKTESSDPEDFISAVDLSTLTFRIDGQFTSSGGEIILKPFYSIHHSFHNVYWYLNSKADPYEKALNDITLDVLTPDGQQDEIGHLLESENSHNGSFTSGITTYYWRDAYGSDGAYFSYNFKVDPQNTNYLYVSYWGSDGGFTNGGVKYTRDFDIYADDVLIASQSLNASSPNTPVNVFYPIPASVTNGKTSIRIKFAASKEKCAGGILEARITSADSVEY